MECVIYFVQTFWVKSVSFRTAWVVLSWETNVRQANPKKMSWGGRDFVAFENRNKKVAWRHVLSGGGNAAALTRPYTNPDRETPAFLGISTSTWTRLWQRMQRAQRQTNQTNWGTSSRQQEMKRGKRGLLEVVGEKEDLLQSWQQQIKKERMRMGTIGGDTLIQWFQRSSLPPCLNLLELVKSWKCNSATMNKSSSLTGIKRAA